MKKILPFIILSMLLSGCNSENISSADGNSAVLTENNNIITSEASTENTSGFSNDEIITGVSDNTTPAESQTDNYEYTEIPAQNTETDETLTENNIVTDENMLLFSQQFDMPADTENYNGLQISFNGDDFPDNCIALTADCFKALENRDSSAYQSLLLPLYRDYLNEYLKESDYTVDKLLNSYYETISETTGGNFSFSRLELKRLYEQDYELMDIPDYISSYTQQLDEISYSNDETYISLTFGNCFSAAFNMYALSDSGSESKVIDSGIITFIQSDGTYYIMLA